MTVRAKLHDENEGAVRKNLTGRAHESAEASGHVCAGKRPGGLGQKAGKWVGVLVFQPKVFSDINNSFSNLENTKIQMTIRK